MVREQIKRLVVVEIIGKNLRKDNINMHKKLYKCVDRLFNITAMFKAVSMVLNIRDIPARFVVIQTFFLMGMSNGVQIWREREVRGQFGIILYFITTVV